MGIILQNWHSEEITFYLKGAEDVMKNKIPEFEKFTVIEECENLGREGLRTLVLAKKVLT